MVYIKEKKYEELTLEEKNEYNSRENKWNENSTERKWQAIREQRDGLLKQTDWAVLPDSPHDTQAIRDYRKALRDLPNNFANPEEVVWPDNPLGG